MKKTINNIAAVVLVLAAAGACAQGAAPSQTDTELNLLKMEVQQLRADIEIMKGHIGRLVQYLQQRDAQSIAPQAPPTSPQAAAGAPATFNVNFAGAPSLGRSDAPVTIVEFSDYECPFCQRYSKSTMQEIKRDYIDTGKVRYVFLDFPLEQMHPKARKAAEAAHCAAEQGKYWEMHDVLFEISPNLDPRQYPDYAKKLQLDTATFELCMGSSKQAARINSGLASGRSAGINATPSFVITKTDRSNIARSGAVITGNQPYDRFRQAIDQALAAK